MYTAWNDWKFVVIHFIRSSSRIIAVRRFANSTFTCGMNRPVLEGELRIGAIERKRDLIKGAMRERPDASAPGVVGGNAALHSSH